MKANRLLRPDSAFPKPQLRLAPLRRITEVHSTLSALAVELPLGRVSAGVAAITHFAELGGAVLPVPLLVHAIGQNSYSLFGGVELAAVSSVVMGSESEAYGLLWIYPQDISDAVRRGIVFYHWMFPQLVNSSCGREPSDRAAFAMKLAASCGIHRKDYVLSDVAELFGVSLRTVKRMAKFSRTSLAGETHDP